LIGSQSLFGAVERQLALKGGRILGLGIVLIWALSPVGGQSALRLLGQTPLFLSFNSTVYYEPIEACSSTYLSTCSGNVEYWPLFTSNFMTAFRTSRKLGNSTEDLFGNVLIPRFSSLVPNASQSENEWTVVDDSHQVSYSSLLGIPVAGTPLTGNSSFNILSRYFDVDCQSLTYMESKGKLTLCSTIPMEIRL
jgi:hypothetical protein